VVAPQHQITERKAAPCAVTPPPPPTPTPGPSPTPRPTPRPTDIQEHVVWIEDSASAAARLEIANRYQTGGVAAWRLGQEDPRVWPILRQWRQGQ
jgi:hypothetical protein